MAPPGDGGSEGGFDESLREGVGERLARGARLRPKKDMLLVRRTVGEWLAVGDKKGLEDVHGGREGRTTNGGQIWSRPSVVSYMWPATS